jgi:2-dehydropantoate 2-reductase
MKFAVVGAGSIGGYLGARLALAGEDVTFIARGATLAAIRANGFKLIAEDGTEQIASTVKAAAIDDPGAYDVILLALKAHQVAAVAAQLPALFGPDTVVVTLQNGIPWWFCHKLGGPYEGHPVKTADPDGSISANIPFERIVGAVVYPASEIVSPGVVRIIEGNRFTLGELDGAKTDRVKLVSEALTRAGFKAPVTTDIRAEIFLKLWGNVVFNPVSALTHATLEDIARFPATRALAEAIMTETRTVAEKLGVRIRISIDKRIAGAEEVGAHKTSMLQDVEAGRELELDAIVGGVAEMARLTDTPTPALDAVYACTKLLAKTLADAGGRIAVQPRN